jgi:hypothetical protein
MPPRNSAAVPVHEIGLPVLCRGRSPEFPRRSLHLEGLEKDLSRISKKFSNKELIGVGFATAGIREALTYLNIVKNAIEKTERVLTKRNTVSKSEGHPEDTHEIGVLG